MPFKPGQSYIGEHKQARIASEFGRALLFRKFGDELANLILSHVGVYRSGKNKGEPRGFIHWEKVTRGGWDYRSRGVVLPGSSGYVFHIEYGIEEGQGVPCGVIYPEAPAYSRLMQLRALGVMLGKWTKGADAPHGAFAGYGEAKAAERVEAAERLERELARINELKIADNRWHEIEMLLAQFGWVDRTPAETENCASFAIAEGTARGLAGL